MSTSDFILLVGAILIILCIYTYEIDTRAYSRGFKEGLEMGKKIGKIDAQAESEE